MPITPDFPGTYLEEVGPDSARTIEAAPTSICVFIGRTLRGPVAADGPASVRSFGDFERDYGGAPPGLSLPHAVRSFFSNGGQHALVVRLQAQQAHASDLHASPDGGPPLTDADYLGDEEAGTGLHAVRRIELFNLLCIPPDAPGGDTAPVVYQAALELCVQHRAMLLVDPPAAWTSVDVLVHDHAAAVAGLGLSGVAGRNAALYFPRILQQEAGSAIPVMRVPCGVVAGVIARTDANRGVWKAPAGLEANMRDVADLALHLDDAGNGALNPVGVNALRVLPFNQKVVWGGTHAARRRCNG